MDFKKHIDIAANEIRDSIGSKKVQTDDYILAAHSKDGYYPISDKISITDQSEMKIEVNANLVKSGR